MGRKQKLIQAAEFDLLFAKEWYCYLNNHIAGVRKIKRNMNKRLRRELKKQLLEDYQI